MKKIIAEALFWVGASLFVLLSVIFGLMHDNLGIVHLRDVVRPMSVLLPIFVVVTLLLLAVHRPLVTVFPAAIFLYFHFFEMNKYIFGFQDVVPLPVLLFGVVSLYPLSLFAIFRLLQKIDGLKAAIYTCFVTAAMAGASFAMIAPAMFYEPPPKVDAYFEKETQGAVSARKIGAAMLPDILYVIPDRYASAAILRSEYGFDNSAFYAELRKRGFKVFEDSWANYPRTFQSLASTLNSGYLDEFTKTYGADSSDHRPVHKKTENNTVQNRLKQLGYQFYNYGGWFEPTRINRWADVNYQGYARDSLWNLSEFERVLLWKTPTMKIARLFTDKEDKRECTRIKRKLHRMGELGNQAQPVFLLAHVFIPHDPIFMNASGECLDKPLHYESLNSKNWGKFKVAYIEYLKYFNSSILEVIDKQLKRRGRSGRKLWFVIQSDEGPYPKSVRKAGKSYDHSRLSKREIKMKIGIINALLLPENLRSDIPNLLTPVNNWRVIFNALTGSKMDLLPDRIFIYPTEKNIFSFCEITDTLTKPGTALPACMNR